MKHENFCHLGIRKWVCERLKSRQTGRKSPQSRTANQLFGVINPVRDWDFPPCCRDFSRSQTKHHRQNFILFTKPLQLRLQSGRVFVEIERAVCRPRRRAISRLRGAISMARAASFKARSLSLRARGARPVCSKCGANSATPRAKSKFT